MEVTLRFFARRFLNRTGYSHLPIELNPIESEGRVRISIKFPPLLTFVVCKKNEAVMVESLEKNDADGRLRFRRGGSEAHGIDIANPRLDRGGEPIGKLLDGIRIEVASMQAADAVVITR